MGREGRKGEGKVENGKGVEKVRKGRGGREEMENGPEKMGREGSGRKAAEDVRSPSITTLRMMI